MTEHTPGPWHIEEERYSGVFSGKRFVLHHVRSDADLIAKVFSGEADAALVVAALELLEQLKNVEPIVRKHGHPLTHDFVLAAIAKAEGKT